MAEWTNVKIKLSMVDKVEAAVHSLCYSVNINKWHVPRENGEHFKQHCKIRDLLEVHGWTVNGNLCET
jgi:hypothetical protein